MPRAGLTPERIISEAATVADEVGLDRLTLAAVAQRCGVSLPGLYKHVSGLDEVRRGIALLAVRELTGAGARAAAGVAGADALRAISAAYRSYALACPGRYAASVLAPAPGDEEHAEVATEAFEMIAAALAGYHLEGDPRGADVAGRLPRHRHAADRGRVRAAGIGGRHVRVPGRRPGRRVLSDGGNRMTR
jgi:AcrR family transcriptional regulator